MREHWWSLPGPSRFLDRVERDIRDGLSIFLELPEERPEGLRGALTERFAESALHWEDVSAAAGDKPLNMLYDLFLPEHPPSALRTMEGLTEGGGFTMLIVWLEGVAEGDADAWADFFGKFGALCRARPDWLHPVFIVPDAAAWDAQRRLRSMPYASFARWDDAVERLDAQMYIGALQLASGGTKLEQQVARQMIAELALWDRRLIHYLADLPDAELYQPDQALLAYARDELGWEPAAAAEVDIAWRQGMAFRVEERLEWHSAWLALNGHAAQLRRRLWGAQVSVLFPYMELLRHRLLELVGPHVELPVYDEKGYAVHDAFDLEFRHLYHFMSKTAAGRFPPQLVAYVNELRRIRNLLAHLDVLGAENIRLLAHPPQPLAGREEFAAS